MLFPALLLAVLFWQPWSYADLPYTPARGEGLTYVQMGPPLPRPGDDVRLGRALHEPVPEAPAPAPQPAPEPAPAPPPEPVQPPAPPPPAPTFSIPADGIEAIVCSLPWPCEEALAVARCESGTDAAGRLDGNYAQSSRNSYGLFQINAVHANRWPDFWESWMDPAKNAGWAFEIWSQQGWRPWSCRP